MSTSVKSSEKQLPIQETFSSILLLNSSNFRLKKCERPLDYQNYLKNQVGMGLGRVRMKKKFTETITHKILETNSSFQVK